MDKEINQDYVIMFDTIENNIMNIYTKKLGVIGSIIYHEKFKAYVFLPIENFYYKAGILFIIVKKLNELNNFKRSVKNV